MATSGMKVKVSFVDDSSYLIETREIIVNDINALELVVPRGAQKCSIEQQVDTEVEPSSEVYKEVFMFQNRVAELK